MGLNLVGAASGAAQVGRQQEMDLQEMLARAFAQKQAEAQMELQRQAAARAEAAQRQSGEQFTQRLEFDKSRESADQTYRQGQVERQGRLDDRQATADRQVENQRGVRRMIGEFLVQRGATPLDTGARQTLGGMAVQEDIDLPKTITDDPNKDLEQRKALLEVEHRNRLAEIGATGDQARRTQAVRPPTAAEAKAALEAKTQANTTAETRRQIRALAQTILNDPALPGITGPIAGRRETFFEGPSVGAKRNLDQLLNSLALNERSKLKGSGAISNFETEMLMRAVSAIDRAAGDKIVKQHLQDIVTAFEGDAPRDEVVQPEIDMNAADADYDFINGRLVKRGRR
jgi:hypothetical protein